MARYGANSSRTNTNGGCRAARHPNLAVDPQLLQVSLFRPDVHRQLWTAPGECARPPEHSRQVNTPRFSKEAGLAVLFAFGRAWPGTTHYVRSP